MNTPTINLIQHKEFEFLEAIPPQLIHDTPIVLIHGAYNKADIWKSNFLPYFAEAGFTTYAINLKKTVDHDHAKTLFRYNLADYVKTVTNFLAALDKPCILVGHSMGGFITQKIINETNAKVKAAFLLASVSPFGIKRALRANTLQNFTNGLKYLAITLYPNIANATFGKPPTGLFAESCPKHVIKDAKSVMIRESLFSLFGLINPELKLKKNLTTPVFVMGAMEDKLVLPMDVLETAKAYQVSYKMFPKMGHAMTLGYRWKAVADYIQQKIETVLPKKVALESYEL